MSRPASSYESGSGIGNRFEERAQRYFHSRRVRKGEVEKPWLEKRHPKEKWVTILPIIGILVGLGISGVLVWDGIRSVVKHNYCMVLDENFSGGLRDDVWTKEVTVGGFGYVLELSNATTRNAWQITNKLFTAMASSKKQLGPTKMFLSKTESLRSRPLYKMRPRSNRILLST